MTAPRSFAEFHPYPYGYPTRTVSRAWDAVWAVLKVLGYLTLSFLAILFLVPFLALAAVVALCVGLVVILGGVFS